MVYLKDNLRFQNVLSKEYCVDYKDVEKCVNAFVEDIKTHDIKIRGPVFYGIHSYSEEGPVKIEIFAPLFSSKVIPDGMNFHTYYSVEHMASAKVTSNLENNTMPILEMLIRTINTIGGEIASPIYFIKDEVLGQPYITIKIGYKKDNK